MKLVLDTIRQYLSPTLFLNNMIVVFFISFICQTLKDLKTTGWKMKSNGTGQQIFRVEQATIWNWIWSTNSWIETLKVNRQPVNFGFDGS